MRTILPIKTLRLSLGLFFIVLGLAGIFKSWSESVFSITAKFSNLERIFGFVEIVCGVLLIFGLFTLMKKSTVRLASFVVFIFWLARIGFSKFIYGITINNAGIWFKQGFSTWLLILCCELVIAASIYVIYKIYE